MPAKGNGNSDLILYIHPNSFFSQKVLYCLYEKQIPFRTRIVNVWRGGQFSDSFLSLNPKGEVPVLVDDVRVIPDSTQIINYLEDNFRGKVRLSPEKSEERARCESLLELLNTLNIHNLTFGSAVFDELQAELRPKPPYDTPLAREEMREIASNHMGWYVNQSSKFPQFKQDFDAKVERLKAHEGCLTKRDVYEDLLLQIERILDEAEAELASHTDQTWFLVSPSPSVADISLSILLHRLTQLGFEERMMNKNLRPYLVKYFAVMSHQPSFKLSISQGNHSNSTYSPSAWFKDPLIIGIVTGSIAVVAGFLLFKRKSEISGLASKILEKKLPDGPDGRKLVKNGIWGETELN